jgi:hypothetical protein
MVALVQFWGTVAILGLLCVLCFSWIAWPIIKAKWVTPGSTTANAGDKVAALVDQGLMLLALADCYVLARKRSDSKIIDLLNQVRQASATWDDSIPAVISTPSSVDAVIAEALAKVKELAQ